MHFYISIDATVFIKRGHKNLFPMMIHDYIIKLAKYVLINIIYKFFGGYETLT